MKTKQTRKVKYIILATMAASLITAIADCNLYDTPSQSCGTPVTPTCPDCLEVDCPNSYTCEYDGTGQYLQCYTKAEPTNHCEQWSRNCNGFPYTCEEVTDDGSTGTETCTNVTTLACGG